MATKGQLTGMLGVYLTAAELTHRGFIVSPTSRSAAGADLLVTDQWCQRTWSVQVKTNREAANFWLLNQHADRMKSASHVYVFVNLKGEARPEYLVVPSEIVAEKMCNEKSPKGSVFHSFSAEDGKGYIASTGWPESAEHSNEGWQLFGNPGPIAEGSNSDESN